MLVYSWENHLFLWAMASIAILTEPEGKLRPQAAVFCDKLPLSETRVYWLVVEPYPSEKYESIGMMTFPIYGKIKNVPNHQPEIVSTVIYQLFGFPQNQSKHQILTI